MLFETSGTALAALLVALVADALLGEPAGSTAISRTPVVLIGSAVIRLERRLLQPEARAVAKRRADVLLLGLVVGAAIVAGVLLAGIACVCCPRAGSPRAC